MAVLFARDHGDFSTQTFHGVDFIATRLAFRVWLGYQCDLENELN